jgi:DNA-binding IclR family transcriptional regulator
MAAVLDFMADHPGEAFALTDLVRALKLSRATCHALLTGLVEVGYLYRTSEKSYVLGPALATIGRVAAENFSPLQIARPEMRRLADQYDVVCSALFLEGDTIVSRERAASASHVGYSIPVGTRIPLRPRSMTLFYAWSPVEARAFLERARPPLSPEERAAVEASMAFARANGFSAHVRNPAYSGNDWTTEPYRTDDPDLPVKVAADIDPQAEMTISSITAPVFGARGKVEFILGLMGFDRMMRGEEIIAVAETLKAAAGRIGNFIPSEPAAA